MVEVWPYTERSRGIAVFQLFGRLAGFFTTFVNPIGLRNISWKWLIVYCCWLAYEVVFVWFLFPETAGRTLEELAFCKCEGSQRPHFDLLFFSVYFSANKICSVRRRRTCNFGHRSGRKDPPRRGQTQHWRQALGTFLAGPSRI